MIDRSKLNPLKSIVPIVFLLLSLSAHPLITPSQWDFGTKSDREVLSRQISIENESTEPLEIAFLPKCYCLSVKPGKIVVPPGRKVYVTLRLDPSGISGSITRLFMIRSNDKKLDLTPYLVSGTIVPGSSPYEDPEGCVPCSE